MIRSILFVGDTSWPMYVDAFYRAACKVDGLRAGLLRHADAEFDLVQNLSIYKRAEQKFSLGTHIAKLNRMLLKVAEKGQYEVVFLYADRFIRPGTVKRLKRNGVIVCAYCNDDPFATYFPKFYWRYLRASVRYCDLMYSYRRKNMEEYRRIGARRVELLRAYYIKERNYPISGAKVEDDALEVVFLGHREKDERDACLGALMEAGVSVGVTREAFGAVFPEGTPGVTLLDNAFDDYNLYMNRAKIAVVFLSKINNDTYTRRCFEIPATKTMMLAPWTEDLAAMFEEGREAVFYRSKEDFVDKVKYYLAHPKEREAIAQAGYERVMRDGHEAEDRVRKILADCEEICA